MRFISHATASLSSRRHQSKYNLSIDQPGSRIMDAHEASSRPNNLSVAAARGNPQMIALLHGKTNTPRPRSRVNKPRQPIASKSPWYSLHGHVYWSSIERIYNTFKSNTRKWYITEQTNYFLTSNHAPRRPKLYCHSRAVTHCATPATSAHSVDASRY